MATGGLALLLQIQLLPHMLLPAHSLVATLYADHNAVYFSAATRNT